MRRFFLVLLYGIFPKVKAEMDLVISTEDQFDAADEQLQVAMVETNGGFAYWHLLILVMVVSFVSYYAGLWIGQRRRQAFVREVLDHNGTLMDRVVYLATQLETNQEERDYLRRQVAILDGTVDRGKHLRHLAREVSDRAIREVTAHHHSCPFNASVYTATRGGMVWHRLRECHHLRQTPDQWLREWRPCSNCSVGVLPPFQRFGGETLHEQLTELRTFAGDPEQTRALQPAPEPDED